MGQSALWASARIVDNLYMTASANHQIGSIVTHPQIGNGSAPTHSVECSCGWSFLAYSEAEAAAAVERHTPRDRMASDRATVIGEYAGEPVVVERGLRNPDEITVTYGAPELGKRNVLARFLAGRPANLTVVVREIGLRPRDLRAMIAAAGL